VLVEWNDTTAEPPGERLIHRWFEAQAARTPTAAAVVAAGRTLSYAELDARANRLAHHLVGLGAGPDVAVGLCVDRSPEMVVGILGILKAGAAYVPLDPEYPRDRLAYMVEDSRTPLVVTESRLRDSLPGVDAGVVLLDELAGGAKAPPAVAAGPENLAYVIYTSGSTGRPKGVQVEHRNLVHSTHARVLGYRRPVDRFLLLSSFAFDSSVAGLFWTLCQGGTLVLPPRDAQGDPAAIARLVPEHRVSHVLCVPTLLGLVLAEAPALALESLTTVIVAGEACPRELPGRLRACLPGAELYNEYGPTEATVWSTVHRCDPGALGAVSIGRPVANTRTYVVDDQLRPVPAGVPGELLVGGEGVARGYLGRPALTAERFLPDPFGGRPGGRLYRTGDLVRWRLDGTLEFLGRLDGQVKIRGHRIELGEVEAALGRHPSVREAVAVAREDSPGDQRLVAYFVPANGSIPPAAELRNWLRASLPEPMVPSAFVPLEGLPLSPNGKVDRRALPRPERSTPAQEHDDGPPRTPAEEIVAATWAAVLGLERVGLHDDFFALGGHSLLATQVVSRLRDAFSIDVPLRTLFEAPTVSALAQRVERIRGAGRGRSGPAIVAGPRGGSAPVSYAQQALWFLDRLAPGQATFNVNASARIRGPLSLDGPAQGTRRDRPPPRRPAHHIRPGRRRAGPGRCPLDRGAPGGPRPGRPARTRARRRGRTPGGRGVAPAVRPGPRAARPRRRAPARRRRPRARAHDAPHRHRRLVVRRGRPRARRVVRGGAERRRPRAARAGDPVRRLRPLAARVAPGRGPGRAARLLDEAARRRCRPWSSPPTAPGRPCVPPPARTACSRSRPT